MIDKISSTPQVYSPDTVNAAASVQPASSGMQVAVSMLEKSVDTQSIALTQFLNQLGIGNNIDFSA